MQTPCSNPKPLGHGTVFGEFSRYQLVRHESHRGQEFSCWMVMDAEASDPLFPELPAIIRQASTIEEAVAGLLEVR